MLGRLDQFLLQFGAGALDHLFGNLHFTALCIDVRARQLLWLADYFNFVSAAGLQGLGLSPDLVVYLLEFPRVTELLQLHGPSTDRMPTPAEITLDFQPEFRPIASRA